MRISVLESDPGFHNFIAKSTEYVTKVFIDGVLVYGVMTADEESGFALCAKTDINGNLIKPIETFERFGLVKIVFEHRELVAS